MQFLVIGRDGNDKKAMERRLKVRQAHLDLGDEMEKSGNRWYGAVLLDDNNGMIGSVSIMDFSSKKDLQTWLNREPYFTGGVWKSIEVIKCNVKKPWKFNRPKSFFQSREETAEILAIPGAKAKIRKGEKQIKKGEFIPLSDLK